ncbi:MULTISPECIES: glucosamine-6-phosphate deaminase [Mammaliicoccus]|jgi:glucosamine-6-phosphate deaminase|uniref:Glucosamine-6-phosphate deaminase n=1 Tax=Mammaliicoccus lentus TaxID=42858 RepID=A0AAX3W4L1_MAMLE|nr:MULTISPECIES: glucosamine-6-phosphate deaminase [Mammaliicoccus]HBV03471.1 glucosamine-6-phosphate deaminase [Staphylococcus sp.]ATZ72117.1 glucosamine-6-phosphate deaminase [Mammaliicoccus lentus]MBF0749891.1 glucosamine-6-phosphate deaminase [Mammaliicoccus lentus]MBF0795045.1 glucosamine-6-phosphate deaminase [Mammaliicoccus lentus]MBU6112703.1 glucosamine-6-phosphate deaminase [Mammaliicoccus lentus]
MKFINLGTEKEACHYVANELLKQIITDNKSVLGLATGGTMVGVYEQLVNLIKINKLDLSNITTFNLDEYIGIDSDHPESYYTYMHDILFNHLSSWNEEKIHLPHGSANDLNSEVERYENLIDKEGPMDIQILGIGENGHIGFNEPGTSFDSLTSVVDLTESTIEANSRYFETKEEVPKQAISMGIQSILKAKRIILLAFGPKKAEAIQKLLSGEITTDLPASALYNHPNVEIIVDNSAYSNKES